MREEFSLCAPRVEDVLSPARISRASSARVDIRVLGLYGVAMEKKRRRTTGIRIPEDLHERLKEAAAERDLSINYMVVKAVEEFLDNLIPAGELKLTRSPWSS